MCIFVLRSPFSCDWQSGLEFIRFEISEQQNRKVIIKQNDASSHEIVKLMVVKKFCTGDFRWIAVSEFRRSGGWLGS